MPITITPTQPAGVFTPAGWVGWSSDFVGPLPTGTTVVARWYADTEETQLMWSGRFSTATPSGAFYTWLTVEQGSFRVYQYLPAEAASTAMRVELQEPGNVVIDTGVQLAPWSSTIGLADLTQREAGSTTGGGLTDEQALQLSQTQASTYPTQLLDNVTLQPLTSGPEPGPVNSGLLHFTFGVIVRIATVPADMLPGTADGDYWFETLASVRVFRGADLWIRVPVHTSSKIVNFVEQNVVAGLAQVTGTLWLLNMSVQVDFASGVTGEVFLMVFP